MNGNVNILFPTDNHGFTLIELLAAVTISILIVSVALGLFQETSASHQTIGRKIENYNQSFRLSRLIKKMISQNIGNIIMGDDSRLTLISTANLTGYGDEVITISSSTDKDKSRTTVIEIIPIVFLLPMFDQELVSQVYFKEINVEKETIKQTIPGVKTIFEYDFAAAEQEKHPDQHSGNYVKATFISADEKKFFVTVSK